MQLHVESTNRRVDVIEEGFDMAIRVRFPPLEDSDLVMKVLGNSVQSLVASPAFLPRFSTPPTPADLSGLPSLYWGSAQRDYAWELFGPDGATALISHTPKLITDDLPALCQAAVAGLGVVHVPNVVVRDHIASGQLINVLPQWAPKSGIVHAVFPSRRGLLPSVRTLIDFLAEEFSHSDVI